MGFRQVKIKKDTNIKQLCKDEDVEYVRGIGFYEVGDKKEKVSAAKELVVLKGGKRFIGEQARKQLKWKADATQTVSKDDLPKSVRLFVQSTSVNRKIKKGTTILLKVEDEEEEEDVDDKGKEEEEEEEEEEEVESRPAKKSKKVREKVEFFVKGSEWAGTASQAAEKFILVMKIDNISGSDISGHFYWPTIGAAVSKFKGKKTGNEFKVQEYEAVEGGDKLELPTDYSLYHNEEKIVGTYSLSDSSLGVGVGVVELSIVQ